MARVEQPTSLNAGVYPNPSRDVFNVTLRSNSDGPITLKIHNQFGSTIKVVTNVDNNSTITIGGDIQKGQYFLIAEQGTQKKIIKLIKQ
jgi:hypothetical protein